MVTLLLNPMVTLLLVKPTTFSPLPHYFGFRIIVLKKSSASDPIPRAIQSCLNKRFITTITNYCKCSNRIILDWLFHKVFENCIRQNDKINLNKPLHASVMHVSDKSCMFVTLWGLQVLSSMLKETAQEFPICSVSWWIHIVAGSRHPATVPPTQPPSYNYG